MARPNPGSAPQPIPEGAFRPVLHNNISALTAIARRTGGSASQCPLPEVRAAFRDMGETLSPVRDDPHQRLAA